MLVDILAAVVLTAAIMVGVPLVHQIVLCLIDRMREESYESGAREARRP